LIGLWLTREYLVWGRIAESLPVVRMLLAFGFFLVLGNAMGVVQTYADSTLLGHFMKDVDVGHYAVAGVLILAVRLPPQAIQTITGPMIARYWGASQIDSIQNLVNRCVKYTMFYAILSAFTLTFLSEELIRGFFGAGYLVAVLPFRILLLGTAFAAIQASVGSALESTAYVRMQAVISAVFLVVGVGLNLILIPTVGIAGAAVATSATMTVSALTRLYLTQRLIGIRIDWMWIARLFAVVAIVFALTWIAAVFVNRYLSLLLALVILSSVMLKYFVNLEDRERMKSILRRQTGV
jgi:O-antigen/teichoic acid export membrane protein